MRPIQFIPVLALTVVFACTRKPISEAEDKDDEVPEVAIVQLQKQELFDYMSFSGTLTARSQETIYSPLSGKIWELSVHEGSKVSKGDKLLVIKPDGEGYEFRDHIIRASRSGTVLGGLLAKSGTHTDRNQELLSIADLSSFKTEVSATVDDLPFLKKDQEVEIVLSASHKEKRIKGSVQVVSRAPDVKTKTFAVTIAIPCRDSESCSHVYPGLLGKVIAKKNPHMGYRLPFKYLRRQKSHILVLNEDNTVSFVEVEVGQHYGQDVEVLKGISPQTRIVTSFSTMPQEGQKVKIAAPEPDKAPH